MDTSRLKRFAPKCRVDLIDRIGAKLDYVLTAKTPDLAAQAPLLKELERALEREGRAALLERVAYTWFNRFAAFRYLDARGWHPFRARLITAATPDTVLPELLQQVRTGVVPEELRGFVPLARINDLLDGRLPSPNPQAEVQRLLVIGVSQYYAVLLPTVFDRIDAFSELLLPDDLLTEHSVVHGFVDAITDKDCAEVEVLGWLYQFYIADRKNTVMARKSAAPTEDIPAVTQLFTPHWIVRYLVENSLGRLWLLNRPGSKLREHMPYYIEEASSPVASDQGLVASSESGASHQPLVTNHSAAAPDSYLKINRPQDIKLMDPAVGSGHMLTYAFDLLYLIYEEEGHTPSEIPGLILRFNLHGLEICPRAAQLAELALVFKARNASRRFFQPEHFVRPNIIELREVSFAEGELPMEWLVASDQWPAGKVPGKTDILHDLHLFIDAKNFGSLLQPNLSEAQLRFLKQRVTDYWPPTTDHLFAQNVRERVLRVLEEAEALTQRYHVVVANPPYMGVRGMNPRIKLFLEEQYGDYKSDLFASFVGRCLTLAVEQGYLGFMSPFVWMFISSYERMRSRLLTQATITSLVQLEYSGFEGPTVPICSFTIQNSNQRGYRGGFIRLSEFKGSGNQAPKTREAIANQDCGWFYRASAEDFKKITGWPIAYWVSDSIRALFASSEPLDRVAKPRQGLATTNNDLFLRRWTEVSSAQIGFGMASEDEAETSGAKWFPLQKGGSFRKWYGNHEIVVNYERRGKTMCDFIDNTPGARVGSNGRVINRHLYFKEGMSWSSLSSAALSMRYMPRGFIFGAKGSACFCVKPSQLRQMLGYFNSVLVNKLLQAISPTLDFAEGSLSRLPLREFNSSAQQTIADECVAVARADWDNFETSWDFRDQPLLRSGQWLVVSGQQDPRTSFPLSANPYPLSTTLEKSWRNWEAQSTAAIHRMRELETENNRLFIAAYGLEGELKPEVPPEQITLARADARKDMAAFLSYAVGCMMGRYSLEAPGLILANAGDTVEDYWRIVAEKANTVASGQGLVASDRENDYDKKLQRSDRVVEGHAAGDANLQSYEAVPQGRTLRPDESNSQSSGVHPVKYSGGPGETGDGGIQTLSVDRPGISGGSGDPASDRSGSELPLDVGPGGHPSDSHRNRQDAQRADKKSEPQTLTTSHQPLASSHPTLTTSHEPLASKFHPDTDGILPVLDSEWFEDDIVARVRDFLSATFGPETLEKNVAFLEESLGKDLRKYFTANTGGFYADHLQTYKKRPIYWMFESPKKHFRALVYLHRYDKDTVNRLLNGYLREFRHKLTHRRDELQALADTGSASTPELKTLDKIKVALKDVEDYEREILLPLARQQLAIDLDDGVKTNYLKFGKALAPIPGLAAKEK